VKVPHAIDDARRLIETRLGEIAAESERLLRAAAALREGSGRRGRRPGRSPKRVSTPTSTSSNSKRRSGGKRKASKRAAPGQRRDELLAAIKATPGAGPSELARSIGVNPPQVHALIAKLRAEKLIVKAGKGYRLSVKADS
jgi:hypothetical protein